MSRPATIREIRQRFPMASSELMIKAVEEEKTIEEAAELLTEELEAENARLRERLAELESESASVAQASWSGIVARFVAKGMSQAAAAAKAKKFYPAMAQRVIDKANRRHG